MGFFLLTLIFTTTIHLHYIFCNNHLFPEVQAGLTSEDSEAFHGTAAHIESFTMTSDYFRLWTNRYLG